MSPKSAHLWGALRQLVWERAGGRCERCGLTLPPEWECHHRKLRSQGGRDALVNLIALHMRCHNAGETGSVHHSPGKAYDLGYLVRSHQTPEATPLLLHGKRWVLLDHDGGYSETAPPHHTTEGTP